MNIIIFFPGTLLFDLYRDRDDIYFFDDHGFHVCDQGKRRLEKSSIDISPEAFRSRIDVRDSVLQLRLFGPLLSRWVSRGDQYELIIRDALLDIYTIADLLKAFNIEVAIFHTGVTHHIDSLVCERACVSAKISQVFLYSNAILLGRLLPLIQNSDITDRRPLGALIADYDSQISINSFIDNFNLGNPPECGGKFPDLKHKNYYAALLMALIVATRSFFSQTLGSLIMKKKYSETIFKKYQNLFTNHALISQIRQQREAIRYYANTIKRNRKAEISNKHKIALLFASNFQPEATSFPEGWNLHNTIDVVIELRRLGYTQKILYKEHPASNFYTWPIIGFTKVGMYRSKRYYQQLEALGCFFIDSRIRLTTEFCTTEGYLPVTISGSIAVERALAGFHTIYTGYPWWKGLPGTVHISDISSLNLLPQEWVEHDSSVATSAFTFLEKMLSGKSILNAPSIGLDNEPSQISDDSKYLFAKEFNSLISYLKNRVRSENAL